MRPNPKIQPDQQHSRQLSDLQEAVINAFLNYDTSYLNNIDPDAKYYGRSKDEFISKIHREIENLKIKYPKGLYIEESVCMYCNPGEPAFSFYAKGLDEFAERYVFYEDDYQYCVHSCGNQPIEYDENGMPF